MPAPTVEIFPNGPIKITGAPSLCAFGEDQAVDGALFLCRCGGSAKAPYCDGTHKRIGFDGSGPAPGAAEPRIWEGTRVRTRFDPAVCMHVFYCKPMSALREREAHGEVEAAQEILRVVDSCPSGALQAEVIGDLEAAPLPDRGPPIEVIEGGEIRLRIPFTPLNFARHEGQPEDRATLCRCGQSASKPFCDGRHRGRKDFR